MEKQESTLTINDPSKDFDGKPVTVTFETNRASDEAVVEFFDAGGACFLFLRTRRTQRFAPGGKRPSMGIGFFYGQEEPRLWFLRKSVIPFWVA